ncbi:MAG: VWA domain-containing protein [Spirochaetales bacterium]
MVAFDYPSRLLAIIVLIPLLYLHHFWKKRGSVFPFPFSLWQEQGFKPKLYGLRFLVLLRSACLWFGIGVLLLAWAGPVKTVRETVYLESDADIMLVLDESPSMAAKDFQPENRFEAARAVIRKFLERRVNDSVGLVSFALEAALRVPLTTDYAHLLEVLDSLTIMDLGDGTALGIGITLGLIHLKDSETKNKIMILLTDGKQNAGEISVETAAQLASDMGVRIYVIGIGREGETYIDFTNPKTGIRYAGLFEQGFDERVLREIATRSSGEYFHAADPVTLSSVFSVIDSLERKGGRSKVQVKRISLQTAYALASFALLGMYGVLRSFILKEVW